MSLMLQQFWKLVVCFEHFFILDDEIVQNRFSVLIG